LTAYVLTQTVFDQFLLAGLCGEIALGKGDGLFAWIAILGNQVAGVTGEHEVVHGTF
jgi:hypothetical protein